MNTDFNATRPALGTAIVERLRTLWRSGAAGARAGAPGRLAIDGLPDTWTQLEAGGLYALYAAAQTPPATRSSGKARAMRARAT